MSENTSTTATSQTPLLDRLRSLLVAHRPAFKQERTFLRAQALAFGHLFCFARRTITQSLVALGLLDSDWSAFYRLFSFEGRIDYEALSATFLEQTLPLFGPADPYTAVVDGVQIPRHSTKMAGTSWLRNPMSPAFMPGILRYQRFSHLACLPPASAEGYSRALPIRFEPAFPRKAVGAEGFGAKKEWEAALDGIGWLRGRLDAAEGQGGRDLLVVGDGSYCVADLIERLPEEGVTLMARCAKNRALYELPKEGDHASKKYGERAPKPEGWLCRRKGFRHKKLKVRGRELHVRYRLEGPYVMKRAPSRPVFLMVVGGANKKRYKKRRKPAFFVITARKAAAGGWELAHGEGLLLSLAWQRWEVEVSHREMKSSFGLGEAQCWNARSVVMVTRWRAWLYGMMVLAGVMAWGLGRGPMRPPGRWWSGSGRWSMGTLWRGYRYEMWGEEGFREVLTPTGGGWVRKEGLMAGLTNAVGGSQRL